ncbi:GcrA family cell cycle regulator [Roseomonas elaeocarpi]|uniref:GcrA family cell cycle regulator n=1 Tax=Roseomonas elaeocarpi TaxID=907779 RepID=A0ABV6JP53_9PROT
MEWTAEAIEMLQALWAEGHSTAEIGRRMGISKNAVVGKAHRLNLSARPSPIRREDSEARAADTPRPAPAPRVAARPAAAAVESAPTPSPAAPPPRPVTAPPVAQVTRPAPPPPVVRAFPRVGARSCCWPIGEPGTPDFRFCTAEATSGRPYCAEHAAIAYVKARDRREDAA